MDIDDIVNVVLKRQALYSTIVIAGSLVTVCLREPGELASMTASRRYRVYHRRRESDFVYLRFVPAPKSTSIEEGIREPGTRAVSSASAVFFIQCMYLLRWISLPTASDHVTEAPRYTEKKPILSSSSPPCSRGSCVIRPETVLPVQMRGRIERDGQANKDVSADHQRAR